MKFKFLTNLTELKDLKHIEWLINHIDEYSLNSDDSKQLVSDLKEQIVKKNIYYANIVQNYNKLCRLFENNPYEYSFDICDTKKEKPIRTSMVNNYFINIEIENQEYLVPFAYLLENDKSSYFDEAKQKFKIKLINHQKDALENFNSIKRMYIQYSDAINFAIEKYYNSEVSQKFYITKKILKYVLFNIFLFKTIIHIKYFGIIFHFWEMFSKNPDKVHSINMIFNNNILVGTLIVIIITYLFIYDLYATYDLYHSIYIKIKYSSIVKDHNNVNNFAKKFFNDYNVCRDGIKITTKCYNHRESVYIPLINMVKQRYIFDYTRLILKDRKLVSILEVESEESPYRMKHQITLNTAITMIVIIYIFVKIFLALS